MGVGILIRQFQMVGPVQQVLERWLRRGGKRVDASAPVAAHVPIRSADPCKIRAKDGANLRAAGLREVAIDRVHVVEPDKSPHAVHRGERSSRHESARLFIHQIALREGNHRGVFSRGSHRMLID